MFVIKTLKKEQFETFVGFISIIFITLTLIYFYDKSPLRTSANYNFYKVHARFGRTDGINFGDEVRIAGVPVGKVIGLRLDKSYGVLLTIELPTNLKLPLDSSASIHTNGLFGKKYVEISPGGDEEYIIFGDYISYTQDSMVVEELLERIISIGKSMRTTNKDAEQEEVTKNEKKSS